MTMQYSNLSSVSSSSASAEQLSSWLVEPTFMTFTHSSSIFGMGRKIEAKGLEEYSKVRKVLLSVPELNIQFDDAICSFTVREHEHVFKSIVEYLDLREHFTMGAISLLQSTRSMSKVFDKGFTLTPEGYESANARKKALLIEADEFYRTRSLVYIKPDPSEKLRPESLFSHFLKHNQGICIGEIHEEQAAKQLLIRNFKVLYNYGVRTLYAEHLFFDTMSHSLSDLMKKYLAYWDRSNRLESAQYNLSSLISKAEAYGIRVVPLDTTLSYLCGTDRKLGVKKAGERMKGFNFVASRIIELDRKQHPEGKFVALMGSCHIAECDGVPGVPALLGCPSVAVEEGKTTTLSLNVDGLHGELGYLSAHLVMRS